MFSGRVSNLAFYRIVGGAWMGDEVLHLAGSKASDSTL